MEAIVIRHLPVALSAAVFATLALSPLHAQQTQRTATTTEQSKPGVVVSNVATMQATVTDIDKATRTITLRSDDGREETMKLGPEVKNFDQIEKGDKVTAEYHEATAIFARKPEAASGAAGSGVQTYGKAELAPLGQKPSGVFADVTEVVATVDAIDYAKRQVTLKGPTGKMRTINVAEDVPNLENVKKGDDVVIRYSEALAISVTK
jgi:hypothetical protein